MRGTPTEIIAFFPLLLDGDRGSASLWVERDCARRLVGAKVKGEGTLVRS